MRVASNIPITVDAWLFCSLLLELLSHLYFRRLMQRHGLRIPLWKEGMIGGFEMAYVKWCRARGRPYKRFIVVRVLTLINLVVATVVFGLFAP
jgi:hypothetical protein